MERHHDRGGEQSPTASKLRQHVHPSPFPLLDACRRYCAKSETEGRTDYEPAFGKDCAHLLRQLPSYRAGVKWGPPCKKLKSPACWEVLRASRSAISSSTRACPRRASATSTVSSTYTAAIRFWCGC